MLNDVSCPFSNDHNFSSHSHQNLHFRFFSIDIICFARITKIFQIQPFCDALHLRFPLKIFWVKTLSTLYSVEKKVEFQAQDWND